jgi:hypothetical protein
LIILLLHWNPIQTQLIWLVLVYVFCYHWWMWNQWLISHIWKFTIWTMPQSCDVIDAELRLWWFIWEINNSILTQIQYHEQQHLKTGTQWCEVLCFLDYLILRTWKSIRYISYSQTPFCGIDWCVVPLRFASAEVNISSSFYFVTEINNNILSVTVLPWLIILRKLNS